MASSSHINESSFIGSHKGKNDIFSDFSEYIQIEKKKEITLLVRLLEFQHVHVQVCQFKYIIYDLYIGWRKVTVDDLLEKIISIIKKSQ